jgi:DUF971 family protein
MVTGEPKFDFAPGPGTSHDLASSTVQTPANIQLIGNEVAIVWNDGLETYFKMEDLRAASPSAQNIGERDILGNQYGGDGPKKFPGVTVVGWEIVGNYAVRFDFSDSHRTGLYSYDYLRELAERH